MPSSDPQKEIPGETRQVTDKDSDVTMEPGSHLQARRSRRPGDNKVSLNVLVGQQFAIGDTVCSVAPLHVLGRRRPERRPDAASRRHPPPRDRLHQELARPPSSAQTSRLLLQQTQDTKNSECLGARLRPRRT